MCACVLGTGSTLVFFPNKYSCGAHDSRYPCSPVVAFYSLHSLLIVLFPKLNYSLLIVLFELTSWK